MDKQLLNKLMHMAKLELPEVTQEDMLRDINKIVGWIEKLQEVDTQGVEPLSTFSLDAPIMRQDIPQLPLDHERAMSTSKHRDSNYFRVPKVK